MKHTLLIVGNGKFAQAFIQQKIDPTIVCTPWQERADEPTQNTTVLHTGSGREMEQVVAYCNRFHLPFIQSATVEIPSFKSIQFPWIEAPNLSLLIVKFLYMLKKMGKLFEPFAKSLLESHQSAKTSPAKTAQEIQQSLDIASFTSIRSTDYQEKELSIPKKHLSGHAVHKIDIESLGVKLEMKIEAFGRESYIEGAFSLIDMAKNLSYGKVTLSDLIDQGLI